MDILRILVLKRANNVKDTRLRSLEAEGVKEIVDRDAVDIIESKAGYETSKRIVAESQKPRMWEAFTEVQKQKGAQAKKIHDGIRNEFTTIVDGKPIIDVVKLKKFTEGKKMKDLPLVEGVVQKTVDIFITDKALAEKITNKLKKDLAGKSANLDATDIIAIQKGMERFIPVIFDHAIPQGFITKQVPYRDSKGEKKFKEVPGETTGLPNVIKNVTHTQRSIAGETTVEGKVVRTKENFVGWYKNTNVSKTLENLRESIGIMKDGSRNLNTRNNQPVEGLPGVGEVNKRMLITTAKWFNNQGIRETMSEAGLGFEASMLRIADGKPSKSYAKGKDKITTERLLEEINLKLLENPRKTSQLISEIKRSYETLNEAQWEKFKELNDTDFIDIIEREMLAGEGDKASTNYSKLFNKISKLDWVSDGGRVSPEKL